MIRGLTEDYFDIQKSRIEIENQVRAIDQKVAESDKKWMKENVATRLHLIERDIQKKIADWVKEEPIYQYWLGDIKGVGPILSAGLIAWVGDIKRFPTISKLWAYCGLHVDEGGRAVRLKAGHQANWNTRLKTHCWKIGESFVKVGGDYRELYDQFRGEYDRKWLTPEDCGSKGCQNKGDGKCMDGHRYAAAKRKTVKVFLAHLWMKWREMEKLPIDHPFIIGRGGHEHLIEPCKN